MAMGYQKYESPEHRIPRLMKAVVEGAPMGNLRAAIEELAYIVTEYQQISAKLEEKAATLTDESKRHVLYNAVWVLNDACGEFERIKERVLKNVQQKGIMTEMILEEIAILESEFAEIRKALMQLIEMRYWLW
jgi:hypothetical protein